MAASVLVRCLGRTVRYTIEDRSGVTRGEVSTPIVWLFWHNRILLMPYLQQRFCPARQGAVLTSPSKDGEVLASVVKRFGVGTVRGSSNKRPAAALKEMVRRMRGGEDMGITPDGPRGPRYQLQPGAVKLAQLARAPVMAVHVRYKKSWKLKSWDGFLIPKPFTKAEVVFAPLVYVERGADEAMLEEVRLSLETAMKQAAEDSA